MLKNENITFKAIYLRDIIIFSVILALLLYQITEWIIVPKSIGNTQIQTKLIVLVGIIIGVIYIIVQHKRSKNLIIKISDSNGVFSFGKEEISIRNLRIHFFLLKKIPAKMIILNRNILLIIPMYKNPFEQISKEQKQLFKQSIERIENFSENKNFKKWTRLDLIPLSINIFMYLLFTLPFIFFTIFLISAYTNNTQWFNIFK